MIEAFINGIASPVLLFTNVKAPEFPEVIIITLPKKSDAEALEDDWRKIVEFDNE
jgi:hypothetical protein